MVIIAAVVAAVFVLGCSSHKAVRSLVVENRSNEPIQVEWLRPSILKDDKPLSQDTQAPNTREEFKYRKNGYKEVNARRLRIQVRGQTVFELEIPINVKRTEPVVFTYLGCPD